MKILELVFDNQTKLNSLHSLQSGTHIAKVDFFFIWELTLFPIMDIASPDAKCKMFADTWLCDMETLLGDGTHARVYKGHNRHTCEQVAVKVIPIGNKDIVSITAYEREIRIMKTLNHINIVKLYHHERTDKFIYLILEYCDCGSLDQVKKPIGEDQASFWISQLFDALLYLHKKHIAHRDIKLQNILLKEGVVKLADFTLCQEFGDDGIMHSRLGTPLTMAPEIFMGRSEYTDKSDIWSVGVIMYILLSNRWPYPSSVKSPRDIFSWFKSKTCFAPITCISTECSDLITRLLTIDPEKRISWYEITKSPWLSLKEQAHDDEELVDIISRFKLIPRETTEITSMSKSIPVPKPLPSPDTTTDSLIFSGSTSPISLALAALQSCSAPPKLTTPPIPTTSSSESSAPLTISPSTSLTKVRSSSWYGFLSDSFDKGINKLRQQVLPALYNKNTPKIAELPSEKFF